MEACVEYVCSAVSAEKGGAVRLELCSALSEGGLTPSLGLFKRVKTRVGIPVFVMIRPRTGNDFVYDEDELAVMEEDVRAFLGRGADGFVLGVLDKGARVDGAACERLVAAAGGRPVTFHRAFDLVTDPLAALEDVVELGFRRILTSGQEASADKGVDLIRRLHERADGRISVMPGCGVNAGNLNLILTSTGVNEFHGTARRKISLNFPKSSVSLGHVEDESVLYVTSEDKVREMVQIFNKLKK